ncbi:MAG TPA: hypothetical protein VL485_00665 [Ktedonobacteraceae bacterium]|nr:hypothetical protein [Ktedonobacteraceae bacterium]
MAKIYGWDSAGQYVQSHPGKDQKLLKKPVLCSRFTQEKGLFCIKIPNKTPLFLQYVQKAMLNSC